MGCYETHVKGKISSLTKTALVSNETCLTYTASLPGKLQMDSYGILQYTGLSVGIPKGAMQMLWEYGSSTCICVHLEFTWWYPLSEFTNNIAAHMIT